MKIILTTSVALLACAVLLALLWGVQTVILAAIPVPLIVGACMVAALLFVITAVGTAKAIDGIHSKTQKPPTP